MPPVSLLCSVTLLRLRRVRALGVDFDDSTAQLNKLMQPERLPDELIELLCGVVVVK